MKRQEQKKRCFQNFWYQLRKDYRHGICGAAILASLGFGFLFPNGLPRSAESFRDLFLSIVYYGYVLFGKASPVRPTVTQLPSWKWTDDRWEPLRIFPWTWEEFKALWPQYWRLFFTWENFSWYCYKVLQWFNLFAQMILILMPFYLFSVKIRLLCRYQ